MLSFREANRIVLRSIGTISLLVRVIVVLLGPGRVVWNRVTVPPLRRSGLLGKESHTWLAGLLHMLLCMMLTMMLSLMMVFLSMMSVMLLFMMGLLRQGHCPCIALGNVIDELLLVDESRIFRVEPASLARVVKV